LFELFKDVSRGIAKTHQQGFKALNFSLYRFQFGARVGFARGGAELIQPVNGFKVVLQISVIIFRLLAQRDRAIGGGRCCCGSADAEFCSRFRDVVSDVAVDNEKLALPVRVGRSMRITPEVHSFY
jgi:hypothetical protein